MNNNYSICNTYNMANEFNQLNLHKSMDFLTFQAESWFITLSLVFYALDINFRKSELNLSVIYLVSIWASQSRTFQNKNISSCTNSRCDYRRQLVQYQTPIFLEWYAIQTIRRTNRQGLYNEKIKKTFHLEDGYSQIVLIIV